MHVEDTARAYVEVPRQICIGDSCGLPLRADARDSSGATGTRTEAAGGGGRFVTDRPEARDFVDIFGRMAAIRAVCAPDMGRSGAWQRRTVECICVVAVLIVQGGIVQTHISVQLYFSIGTLRYHERFRFANDKVRLQPVAV